jgi:16S rRNA (cytosine1402-N4)-methyltransferase
LVHELHQPVLLEPALRALRVIENGIYIDATFGRGGHSAALLEQLGNDGRLLVFEKDPRAVEFAVHHYGEESRLMIRHGSFVNLKKVVSELGWQGKVNGILFDLGVSSPQLDDAQRGFSFQQDGPLDMRMDPTAGKSAAEWLAQAGEGEIADVLWRYGEERYSRRIARAIVRRRQESPLATTAELVAVICAALPRRDGHKHPATRSFQAIRIHINRELEELETVLPMAVKALVPGGRLAVISFHSLEDRLVKRFIRDQQRGPQLPPDLPVVPQGWVPLLKAVGKPVRATDEEIAANPRARSAILRTAERLA